MASNKRITKAEQIKRLERANKLLQKRGFNVDDSGSGLIVDDLIAEFGVQRRTARLIEAKAARLLRGEVVTAWKSGAGRKPKTATLKNESQIGFWETYEGKSVLSSRVATIEIVKRGTIKIVMDDGKTVYTIYC